MPFLLLMRCFLAQRCGHIHVLSLLYLVDMQSYRDWQFTSVAGGWVTSWTKSCNTCFAGIPIYQQKPTARTCHTLANKHIITCPSYDLFVTLQILHIIEQCKIKIKIQNLVHVSVCLCVLNWLLNHATQHNQTLLEGQHQQSKFFQMQFTK